MYSVSVANTILLHKNTENKQPSLLMSWPYEKSSPVMLILTAKFQQVGCKMQQCSQKQVRK